MVYRLASFNKGYPPRKKQTKHTHSHVTVTRADVSLGMAPSGALTL